MSELETEWLVMVDGAARGNPRRRGMRRCDSGRSDSQLLVRQLNGEYRVKDEKLKILFKRPSRLLRQFEAYRILHVPRELNKLADRLTNKGIDEASKKSSLG